MQPQATFDGWRRETCEKTGRAAKGEHCSAFIATGST